ncbi:MAG: hypothetical protein RIS94_543 [Pseudomonadota bacterium]|jgi:hypothetical protein
MTGGMIRAAGDLAGLNARLVAKARQLAEARAATLLQRGAAAKWRNASLLWPLFGQE